MTLRLPAALLLLASLAFAGVVYADGPALTFEQDGREVAYSDGMMGCDVLGLDGRMHRVDSRVCLALRSMATGKPTPEPTWTDAYAPGETVNIRAPAYFDERGNVVITAAYMGVLYDENSHEIVRGDSPECADSLKAAPEDTFVLCLKQRPTRPVNEPTPNPWRAIEPGRLR